jgi:hydroxymethylpyrimidine pyrophosphatase-like HAD family hydrolase
MTPARRFDLIIADIDGCLVPEGPEPFDLPSLARVAEHNRLAQDRGDRPVLTVCSGRPQPFVEAVCRLVGNTSAPCVAENGVWLYHPGTNEYLLDPAITDEHLAAVEEARRFLRREYGPRGVSQQPGKIASISLYHPDTAYLRSIEADVRDAFGRRGWPFRVSMTWLYINCDLAHVSKGTALDRMLAAMGPGRERLAGIGDTPSDLAIRERVAWFACPANAADTVKRVADYVAAQPEALGVVDILGRI